MRRKTHEQFVKEVYELVKEEYSVIGQYENSKTKIKIKHNNECNYEYEVTPDHFLGGKRCPACAIKNRSNNMKKSHKEFENEVNILGNGEYEILGKYVSSSENIKIRHNICGHQYEVKPSKFIYGNRCPNCFGNIKKTPNEFKQEVFELVGNEYTFLEDYINSQTKIKVKHEKCNHVYEIIPSVFLSGVRCPLCNESKGEKRIRQWLNKYKIIFKPQKEFDGLLGLGGGNLSYDFYLPHQNLLIEYQGQFHDGSSGNYAKINLEKQKEHDMRKRQYANDNEIELLEIWYWEFDDIEEILNTLINTK